MRLRPVRAKIWLPVPIFWVLSSDWKFVLAGSLGGLLVPLLLGLKIWIVPLWVVSAPVTLVASMIFFNYIRTGRRPHWFQHTIRALVRPERERRRLPVDRIKRPHRDWIRSQENQSERGEAR